MGVATRQVKLDWHSVELRACTGEIVADGNGIALRDDAGELWPLGSGPGRVRLSPGDRATLFWCVDGEFQSEWLAVANHRTHEFHIWRDEVDIFVPPRRPLLFWVVAISAVLSLASFTTGVSPLALVILTVSLGYVGLSELRKKKIKDAIRALLADIKRAPPSNGSTGDAAGGHVRI